MVMLDLPEKTYFGSNTKAYFWHTNSDKNMFCHYGTIVK